MTTKAGTSAAFDEDQAKAAIRRALKDLDRGLEQLQATRQQLMKLPGYKRVAAEMAKPHQEANAYADSLAWTLAGDIIGIFDGDLLERVGFLRKSVRATEAVIAARAERDRAREARAKEKAKAKATEPRATMTALAHELDRTSTTLRRASALLEGTRA